ncbi:hypothetical protein HYH03_003339 [Edaphochlamys debaryana]|uniref:Pherophorin domain-containing protein n=1 Tax=Edaphochlamys debaryana TaxID=47281 RepID=A0A835Y9L3_9CHLO|nr:hypothetical protein HYH03_003339 [Edaphochlamys debaryana]|eukprot:KAG2498588.1 hypothetical protein HYH03_003339 [Edaphochlamys debaryana]
MPKVSQSCTALALLGLMAFAVAEDVAAMEGSHARSLIGKAKSAPSGDALPPTPPVVKGMGSVVASFALSKNGACDSANTRSSLAINFTRGDDDYTFCFLVSSITPNNKFACHVPAWATQVDMIQVLAGSDCSESISAITVDGVRTKSYTYDPKAKILVIDRVSAVKLLDPTKPSNRRVCVSLLPTGACNTYDKFCRTTQGPVPACGVLVADKKATCCPVHRVPYPEAPSAPGGSPEERKFLYRVKARFIKNGALNCNAFKRGLPIATEVRGKLEAAVSKALNLTSFAVSVPSVTCLGANFLATIQLRGASADKEQAAIAKAKSYLSPLVKEWDLRKVTVSVLTVAAASPPPAKSPPAPSPSPPPSSPSPLPSPSPSPAGTPPPAYYGGSQQSPPVYGTYA